MSEPTGAESAAVWLPTGDRMDCPSGEAARIAAQQIRTTIGSGQKVRLVVEENGSRIDEALPHLPAESLLSREEGVEILFDLLGHVAGTITPYGGAWALRQHSGDPYYTTPPPAEVFDTYRQARNTLMERWDDVVTDEDPRDRPDASQRVEDVVDVELLDEFVDQVTSTITRNAHATAASKVQDFIRTPIMFARTANGRIVEQNIPDHIAQPDDLVAYLAKAAAVRGYAYLAAQKSVITHAVEDPENPEYSPRRPDYPPAVKMVALFIAPGHSVTWATHLIDADRRLHTRHWHPTHSHGINPTPATDAALLAHRAAQGT